MSGQGNGFGNPLGSLSTIDEMYFDNLGLSGQNFNAGQNNSGTHAGYAGNNLLQSAAPPVSQPTGLGIYNTDEHHAAQSLRSLGAGNRAIPDFSNSPVIRGLTERVAKLEHENEQLKSNQLRLAQDGELLKTNATNQMELFKVHRRKTAENNRVCKHNEMILEAELDRFWAAVSTVIDIVVEDNPERAREFGAEFDFFQQLGK